MVCRNSCYYYSGVIYSLHFLFTMEGADLRYDIWNVSAPDPAALRELEKAGYHPLLATVLASRGLDNEEKVAGFLRSGPDGLHDPFLLEDMDRAVSRFRLALERGEKIAVYGDYDVDGITSVCLLSRYLIEKGADFVTHIPDRAEEGYGLNEAALRELRAGGVSLVITVDSGVTAVELAELAHDIGLSLIITDHHHCGEKLPRADAVVNPCRPGSTYPFGELAGVGVAFKLVCAMEGNQAGRLKMYSDLVALGTLADVMPVTGENRIIIKAGLNALETTDNPGVRALVRESGIKGRLNASSIGFVLAPRLNAAGRVGRAEKAVELLMTGDTDRASALARELCEMNQLRQQIENGIISKAVETLGPFETVEPRGAIVLAGEDWHHGVIGIVASRLAERYRCPVFLICVCGGRGKGSARGVPGVDLVNILADCADVLENYGGHAMAAGFSLGAGNIGEFAKRVGELCASRPDTPSSLYIDAAAEPSLLSRRAAEELSLLEPFGAGNAQPVFFLKETRIAELSPIGSGKHTRASLEAGGMRFQAVWFGVDAKELEFAAGDLVDAAFKLEINRFRGEENLQLQLVDIRPPAGEREAEDTELSAYRTLSGGSGLTGAQARRLLPTRAELGALWRYLGRRGGRSMSVTARRLSRDLARETGHPISLSRILAGLDVFSELGLIEMVRFGENLTIIPAEILEKRDLSDSPLYRRIKLCAEGGSSGG